MCFSFTTSLGDRKKQTCEIDLRFLKEQLSKGDPKRYYARQEVPVLVFHQQKFKQVFMHWDLIPSWYQQGKGLTITDVIRMKKATKTGFSSFNARMESITRKPTYKQAWEKRQRCLFPATFFYEYPNRADRPAHFPQKEYEIPVPQGTFLAGLYDQWRSEKGERLITCTMLTVSGVGVPKMDEIWHDRMPMHVPLDWLME